MNSTKFFDMVVEAAKDMMVKRGRISPHVLALAEGKMGYIALPENKDLWHISTVLGVASLDAEMYAFVSEAWYVDASVKDVSDEEKELMKHGNIMPSQHPARKEGIFIILYSRTEPKRMVAMPFKRGSGPEIIFGEEMREMQNIEDYRIGDVFEEIDRAKRELAQKRCNEQLGGNN